MSWCLKPHAKKKGECPNCGKLFQHFDRQVRKEKRPTVSLYLNELLGRKKKRWVPGTAASCSTLRPTGEKRKADCFTLLRRITRLKCVNSEIQSNVGSYYLERYSPKGSCHLDEPTWVTHLLRTAFWIVDMECIVHAKNQQNRHDETYDYIYI